MKFTFDGSIYENNSSSQDLKSDQKIILSGLIFESNTRLAALPFQSDVTRFLRLDPPGRAKYMVDVFTKLPENQQAQFMDTWSKLERSPSKPESSFSSSGTGLTGIDGYIDKLQSVSNKETGVYDLAKTLECRFYVIQRLKSQIDTQKIGFYFTNLMSKQNLTEEKTCAILNRGADIANSTGARVENVLDFIVAAYDRVKSLTILDQFLRRAESVLEKNRTVPVFQLLNKAINGEKANTRAYLMTIKDPQQMIILNELMTMAQAGPVENMEELRRSWQASLDKAERQTEIYDRRIKVYNMFKAEAANYGIAHVMQSLGSLFKVFQQTGMLDVITNIYFDMKIGQIATNNALAPITRNPTKKPENDAGFGGYSTGFTNPLTSSSTKFIKIAETPQQQNTEGMFSNPMDLFQAIIQTINATVIPLLKANPQFEALVDIAKGVVNILSNFNEKTTLDDISNALGTFGQQYNPSSNQNNQQQVNAAYENSNIRTALVPAMGRLVSGVVRMLGPVFTNFVRNTVSSLALDSDLFFKFALLFTNFIISVIRSYGAQFWGKNLKHDPMFFDSAGRFKQNSPQAIAYTQTLSEAGYSTDQINAMMTFKQVREQVKLKVQNYETKIKDVLQIQVQTGANVTSEAPLKNVDSIKKIYNGFIAELRGAIVQFDKELDFLRNLAAEGQMQLRNQVALNLLTQHLREAEADLQDMKNLLGRYYSFDLIIKNVLMKMRLMKILKPMMSKITKFQTIGVSTAALLSDPNGIFPVLNKIRQMEIENIAKMKADIAAKKLKLPQNYYLD